MGIETSNNEMMSRKQAAQFLGICLTTLDRLDIPRTKVRHRTLYKHEALNKWIDDHTEKSRKARV